MLLLTGASGSIGRRLLERWQGEVLALVHRRSVKARRWMAGDITQPGLGLEQAPLAEVTAILHCAALTEFSADPAILHSVNSLGVQNVLSVARRCPRLRKVGILSTAYVAGRRAGKILESELVHRRGFVNPYERSKYNMESILKQNANDLPIAIYRLSTVLGDSSGRVDQFHALHRALRLYYHALVPMVPGVPGSIVDLINADYAADCVAHLFEVQFRAGETYHIVSPESDRMPLERFLELTAEIFGRYSARWRSGALPIPPIVPLKTFWFLEKSVRLAGNAVLRQVMSATSLFLPQLCFPKDFDQSNLCRDLHGSGIEPRPLLDYYPRIVRECVESKGVLTRHGCP